MSEVDVTLDKALASLKRFTETNSEAHFARFVRLSYRRMMAMLQEFMCGSSHEDREEVLNDAYLAVYRAVICPGPDAKPLRHISEKTWGYLKTALRNAASDRRKRDNAAMRKPDQPIVSTSPDETGNGGIDPRDNKFEEDKLWRCVDFAEIVTLSEKLPEDDRDFFRKLYLEKSDWKQLQDDLGLSWDQFNARHHKILRKLKLLIGLKGVMKRRQVTDLEVQIFSSDQIADRLRPDTADKYDIQQPEIRPLVDRVLGLIHKALAKQGIDPVSIDRTEKKKKREPPSEEL